MLENFKDIFRILFPSRFSWYQFQFSRLILSWTIAVWRHKNNLWKAFWWPKQAETSWIILCGLKWRLLMQERPRELKLVSLESPWNEDSEYIFKIVLSRLWTKWQRKKTSNIILHNLGGGGCCGTSWPTEGVRIVTLCEFDENNRFLTASCGPYMGHTLRLFFLHISL